jgi:2-polyprenyl-6-methoxyphenol hydroxylase-like FAD-dependent oxidoreductase
MLLARREILVTVLEATRGDELPTKLSYYQGIHGRGQTALHKAGLLDQLLASGMPFQGVFKHSFDGSKWVKQHAPNINNSLHFDAEKSGLTGPPAPTTAIAISRFDLTKMLTRLLLAEGRAILRHGVRVSRIEAISDVSALAVTLADGEVMHTSHVIGADGIRSAVRSAAEVLEAYQKEPSFTCCIRTEPIWAIRMPLAYLPADMEAQARTGGFAYHILASKSFGDKVRLVVANNGALSAEVESAAGEHRMVGWLWTSDVVLERYPTLSVTAENGTRVKFCQ